MKLLFIALVSLFLGSCQTTLKTIYGARRPGVQTPEKITRWLRREGLNPQQLASVRPEAFFQTFMDCAGGLKVFSADGRFIPLGYRDGKFCPQGLDLVLASLQPLTPAPPTYSGMELVAVTGTRPLQFNSLFETFRTLKGELLPANPVNADYIVLIPFALWMGRRFQTKDIRSFVKALSQNPNSRFSIWYVNLDKQAWWGDEWNSQITLQ